MAEPTAEDIMNNDVDPLDGIREIRRSEGVSEDELPERDPMEISAASDMHDRNEQENDDGDTAQSGQTEGTGEGDSDEASASTAATKAETETQKEVDDSSQNSDQDRGASSDSQDEGNSDQSSSDEDDSEKEAGTKKDKGPVTRTFRADGKEFTFTQDEIMEQFETVFGQAMNYTQKMQRIAPYRKMISALESEGITHDSLNVAIDALKGDAGAIRSLMEKNNIDPYDLTGEGDDSQPYQPTNYGKDQAVLDIEEITSTIQGDKEFAITTNVIDEQWDDDSRRAIASNPQMIVGLHNDIKSGLYDIVAPAAMKMKVLDGNSKSDIEYYMLAGQQYAQQQQTNEGQQKADELNKQAQDAESKFEKESSEADRKRSASSTGARADRKGVIDYLDDDDEAFEAWYKELHASQ